MNKEKWTRATVPMSSLGLKLAEETGEVVSEILDSAELAWNDERKIDKIITEAQHALFIANCIISRCYELRSDIRAAKREPARYGDGVSTWPVQTNVVRVIITNYPESVPDYGDVIPLAEFLHDVHGGGFTDDDGFGQLAKVTGKGILKMSPVALSPSRIEEATTDATHVVWFNK